MRVSPGICDDVDAVMLEWGQGWVCNDEIVDVNAWLSAKDISAKHPVTVWDVFNWERKGLYKGRKQGSRKLFRVGDVLAAMARR
ncbi:Uncharacterised protein [Mycobacteroides abscessus subsp. bolletii]|nr:Uncharacterised protein [Mycobacteroides abscessus subsp. bolletii]